MDKKYVRVLFRDLTTFGGTIFYGLVTLLSFAFGQTTLAVNLILGFVISLIIVAPIRLLYFKNRPQKQTYSNLLERIDASSFPSWHTARIVFLATTISVYFNTRNITILSVILALTVSYSRIYLQKHDWIDVLGGLVLGLITFFFSSYI